MRGWNTRRWPVPVVLLSVLVLHTLSLHAGISIKDALAAKFMKRAVFIRGFYSNDDLTFDSQGNAIGHPVAGPWSLALFQIEKLKIEKHQIRFEGYRVASVFDTETRKFKTIPLKDPERIRVTIVADAGSAPPDSIEDLVNRVLPSRLDAADVPDYWRDFFNGKAQQFRPRTEYAGAIPGERLEGDAVYSPGALSGVSPPKVIMKEEPDYSEEARKSRIQGTTVMKLFVDKAGLPQDIQVVRPIGFGLDDRAVSAARRWRFKPAMLKGAPVPVQISLEVEFRLF